ncbi:MAG: 2-amino-4-hydroxy-6-hydroxymethyldihydropteridine diphosphokinase [Clostridiales bacterium]|nr:2-amino-4-hydroxy-6-hydroxymethyldihydropteridine diphosphokinase [Clostridiales bacterium]
MAGDTNRVLLSIGSNIGDRKANIEESIRRLNGLADLRVTGISHMYETEPVGYEDQDSFYNVCVLCETGLSPMELLEEIHRIENALHRKRLIRWGPRTIDIDIILYGDETVDTEELQIPHPRYRQRAFVLIPMKDLMEYSGEIPDDKYVKQIPWEFEV